MAGAVRKGDIAKGHGCFPDTPIIEGSPDVFINGQAAARSGDAVAPHGCTCGNGCGTHSRTATEGSPTVFINGKPAVTVGHGISCGGVVISGSGNVFIGNTPRQSPVHECAKQAARQRSPAQALPLMLDEDIPKPEQHAQAAKKHRPEPMPLPALIYQTMHQMDDYEAKDMRCGDLDALTLRNELNIDVDTVSARVNARTLRLLNQPNPCTMSSPYVIASIPEKIPAVSHAEAAALMFDEFRDLAKLFSFHGPYKDIITEMITHMQENSGTPYSSPLLDKALKEQILNDRSEQSSLLKIKRVLKATINYEYGFIPFDVKGDLFDKNGNLKKINEAVLPKFDNLIDRTNGLVITVHDTWATRISLESLEVKGDSFRAKVHYRIQDHFGLDNADIQNPVYKDFRFFRLWIALKRWYEYGYKPFITEMIATVDIS